MRSSGLLSMQEWTNKLKTKVILTGIKVIPSKFIPKNGQSHLLEVEQNTVPLNPSLS